jgi:hypothetical protein
LRRTLLAESLLLSVAGAVLGVLSAQPMVAVLARYASRFSVRALYLKLDMTVLWVGAALAVISAVLLAFVPRLQPRIHQKIIADAAGRMDRCEGMIFPAFTFGRGIRSGSCAQPTIWLSRRLGRPQISTPTSALRSHPHAPLVLPER